MVKEILIGDDLINDIKKYDIILIGASIYNSKGEGFQRKLTKNFPLLDKKNKETNYGDIKKLGTCQIVTSYVDKGFPIFIYCYINRGRYRPDLFPDALDYEALKSCLGLIDAHFKNKKIGTTLIGNSIFEGGGNAEKIYEIIGDNSKNNEYYIYDFIQKPILEEESEEYNTIKKEYADGIITRDEYEMKKCKLFWKEKFGQYLIPFPEDLTTKEILKKIKDRNNWNKN